jgi:ketosteroid isomerase-like protein
MSEQENLGMVRESFEAFNAHDAGRFAALLDEAYVWESDTLPAPLMGPEAARQGAQIYLTAFPDLHSTSSR